MSATTFVKSGLPLASTAKPEAAMAKKLNPFVAPRSAAETLIVGPVLAGSFASEKDARPVARKTRTTPTIRADRAPTAACMALSSGHAPQGIGETERA